MFTGIFIEDLVDSVASILVFHTRGIGPLSKLNRHLIVKFYPEEWTCDGPLEAFRSII